MKKYNAALIAALLLGPAGDLLLRWVPWGINAPLWTAAFLVTVIALLRRHRPQPFLDVALPAIAALLAAIGIAWRDAEALVALDVLLLAVFLPMLAAGPRAIRLAATGLVPLAASLLLTAAQSVAGLFQMMFEDVEWGALPRSHLPRGAGVFLRGLAIALPMLIVFGALLSSADVAFEKLLGNLFDFNLTESVAHIVVTLVIAAACAGFFRSLLGGVAMTIPDRIGWLRLAASETNVALTLVNLLFALFVFIQVRYFFGGATNVLVGKLTWSEYARRGFFELVAVVALVVPLLLVAEWLIDKQHAGRLRLFRILAFVQVALVLVIAASAYRRMQLYREAFGLTHLRLYTTAFMIALAVLLFWFVVTVLTGHRERFAIGALTTAVAAVVTLHAINPDELIVTTNAARARGGLRSFDASYTVQLSDDAVPALMQNLDLLEPCVVRGITNRERTIGWRTWNASRAEAIEVLQERRDELQRISSRCVRSRVERHAADRPRRP